MEEPDAPIIMAKKRVPYRGPVQLDQVISRGVGHQVHEEMDQVYQGKHVNPMLSWKGHHQQFLVDVCPKSGMDFVGQ